MVASRFSPCRRGRAHLKGAICKLWVAPGAWLLAPRSSLLGPHSRLLFRCFVVSWSRPQGRGFRIKGPETVSRVPRPCYNLTAGVCGRRSASRLSSRGCDGWTACGVSVKTVHPGLGKMLSANANCDSRTWGNRRRECQATNGASRKRATDRHSKQSHGENKCCSVAVLPRGRRRVQALTASARAGSEGNRNAVAVVDNRDG
jgi:hypothetical protein